MRCGNCGFQNPDSNVRCEKCNAPLTGSMAGDSPRPRRDEPEQNMRSTKREIDSNTGGNVGTSGGRCPVCGFELTGIEKVCPICHSDLGKQTLPGNEPVHGNHAARNYEPRYEVKKEEPAPAKPLHKMTVSPWDMLYKQSRKVDFYLEPIAFDGEKNVPEAAAFAGDIVALNRDNTEAQNLAISSENQAEIRCIDGQYYILDTSSMGTTFVQAKKPMAINEDDVILLGNRRFVFKKENK